MEEDFIISACLMMASFIYLALSFLARIVFLQYWSRLV